MYDFHIHSKYSIDSESPMETIIESAIENKLVGICFTDHLDLESSKDKIDVDFNLNDYFKEIDKLKEIYKDRIQILAGVEIGMQPHLKERYDEIITSKPFDFVLMSIHQVYEFDISFDKYLYSVNTLSGIRNYYTEMYKSLESFDDFDVLGHLDYVDRYLPPNVCLPPYDQYSDLVGKVLELLIAKGKGLEINTGSKRYGLDYFHPKIEILKKYKELGGKIITLGSDCHNGKDIGVYSNEVIQMLRSLGFKNINIFKERINHEINI